MIASQLRNRTTSFTSFISAINRKSSGLWLGWKRRSFPNSVNATRGGRPSTRNGKGGLLSDSTARPPDTLVVFRYLPLRAVNAGGSFARKLQLLAARIDITAAFQHNVNLWSNQ